MRYPTSTLAVLSLFLPSIFALSAQPISLARGLGPDLKPRQFGVYTGTCAKLTATLDLTAAAAAGQVAGATGVVKANPGACLCVDVYAPLFGAKTATAYVQTSGGVGVTITGQGALNLAGALTAGGGAATIDALSICLSLSLFPNTVPDFTRGCCARKCADGFRNTGTVDSPVCSACSGTTPTSFTTSSGSQVCVGPCPAPGVRDPATGACTCPAPRVPAGGVCSLPICQPPQVRQADGISCGPLVCSNTEILCNGACYPALTTTCTSGIPTPKRKRNNRYQCSKGMTYCPVVGSSGWDCVDTTADIESCGGCADPSIPFGPGVGMDCTIIPGINAVSCDRGNCVVQSCRPGWKHSEDRKYCVPNSTIASEQMIIVRKS